MLESTKESTHITGVPEQWMDWPALLRQAYTVATGSPDPSTQNGAGLVHTSPDRPGGGWASPLTWARNDLPKGAQSLPERWERPLKYAVVEHAERNAIYEAARLGVATDGMTMVCPWAPCTDCARAIIQAGVKTLVTHAGANARTPESWLASLATARELLTEGGVDFVEVDAHLGGVEVRHTGEIWRP